MVSPATALRIGQEKIVTLATFVILNLVRITQHVPTMVPLLAVVVFQDGRG